MKAYCKINPDKDIKETTTAGGLMRIKDLRSNKETEIGDIEEAIGDFSMGFFTTQKGYRLILDRYNMKKIADYYDNLAGFELSATKKES